MPVTADTLMRGGPETVSATGMPDPRSILLKIRVTGTSATVRRAGASRSSIDGGGAGAGAVVAGAVGVVAPGASVVGSGVGSDVAVVATGGVAMDVDGVDYSILYPSVAGRAGETFGGIEDPALELACVQAYNDWLIEEWVGVSPRFIPQCIVPLQPGDVPSTLADISDLERDVGFRPQTPIEVGVERFVRWWLEYRGMTVGGLRAALQ